jgi:hypothetical protein
VRVGGGGGGCFSCSSTTESGIRNLDRCQACLQPASQEDYFPFLGPFSFWLLRSYVRLLQLVLREPTNTLDVMRQEMVVDLGRIMHVTLDATERQREGHARAGCGQSMQAASSIYRAPLSRCGSPR